MGLDKPIKVENIEVIPDVYAEILKLEKEGNILIKKYEENTEEENQNFQKIINKGLQSSNEFYKEFLIAKFPNINKDNLN